MRWLRRRKLDTDYGRPRVAEDAPADMSPDACTHVDDATDRICGARATWHGLSQADWRGFTACDAHSRDLIVAPGVTYVHAWTPACATGQFLPPENCCLPTS